MTAAMSNDLVVTTPLELEIRRLLAEHREGVKNGAAAEVERAKADAATAERVAWRWFICSCALVLLLCGTIAAGGYFGHQRIIAAEQTIDELAANQLDLDRVVETHERKLSGRGGPL